MKRQAGRQAAIFAFLKFVFFLFFSNLANRLRGSSRAAGVQHTLLVRARVQVCGWRP
jgi:hypothetical protein